MAKENLTTLARLKRWMGTDAQEDAESDKLLSGLIQATSRFILNQTFRTSFAYREYLENYDGYGTSFLLLRNWPAHDINYIRFAGFNLTRKAEGNPRTNGYLLQDNEQANGHQRLTLFGYCFPKGRSLIDISYTSGYRRKETHTIPAAPDPSTVSVDFVWLDDLGVVFTDTGVPLTKVSTEPPASGEYLVSDLGVYTFSEDDREKEVDISYSFVPADLTEVCNRLVATQNAYRGREGYKSKTLGGQETVVFDTSALTDYDREVINFYKRIVPL